MNNIAGIAITVGKVIGKSALELIKIGGWGVANQYTNQQFRSNSNQFIGEVERGVEHQARNLKLIKND